MKNKKKKWLWTIADENYLIKLWKERLSYLRSTRRSMPIYEDIRDKLNRKGCYAGVDEVKHKIHNLTTKYKKEKQNRSRGYSPTDWEFYDVLDDMFSTYQPGNIINLEEESSKSFSDDFETLQNASKESTNSRQEYDSEHYSANEEVQNEPEESNSSPRSEGRHTPNRDEDHTQHFKQMNHNIKLMVEKVYELCDNIQSWEERGNAQLRQISQILKNHTTKTNEDNSKDSVSSRKRKLSQHDEDDSIDISTFQKLLPVGEGVNDNEMRLTAVMKASVTKSNKSVLDDYLKTMELERQFLTEKHNIQIEILKLELEAKRIECLKDT